MTTARNPRICCYQLLTLITCLFVLPAYAKYSGGTGEPNDPYQIATAADLIALGEDPNDYDKHFILTADIDLDPNLPGRKVFDKAVIAAGTYEWTVGFQGTPFTGVFDGNGHTISHLTITGQSYLGLFGQLASGAEVRDLGVVDVNVVGSSSAAGGIVGCNRGAVSQCHSTGAVSGEWGVGGLVGYNDYGSVTQCHSTAMVRGIGQWSSHVGGLVGSSNGDLTNCYSTGAVSGTEYVGGLVGYNGSSYSSGAVVADCYSTGAVNGSRDVGGLVGTNNEGDVTRCYSTGAVSGDSHVGGLVGDNLGGVLRYCYSRGSVSGRDSVGGLAGYSSGVGNNWYHPAYVFYCYSAGRVMGDTNVGGLIGGGGSEFTACLWDIQTSGQATSAGGTGRTTAQMKDIHACQEAGWDFVGAVDDGTCEVWQMPSEGGYPILAVFSGYTPPQLQGSGTQEDPYLISDALELGAVVYYSPSAQYRLTASIDLSGIRWGTPAIPWFSGMFDGSGHTISHLTIEGQDHLGLFGRFTGAVWNLGIVDVNITGSGDCVGGLVGWNDDGVIDCCYSTGAVSGAGDSVGGLVGANAGNITASYSTGTVSGTGGGVGGLVGRSSFGWWFSPPGYVNQCYSTGAVTGDGNDVGGLVGSNGGSVTQCYSTGKVSGKDYVGGLVGYGGWGVTASFWDTQTSGCTTSEGGTGKSTGEMQTAKTFLDAGWDFVGETANGTQDIWWINEGKDYPRLWWEAK